MTKLPVRQFGAMFGFVFAALAVWLRGSPPLLGLFSLLALMTVLAMVVRPSLLEAPTRTWLRFGELVHRVINPVVLGAMYLLLIVPAGFLRRTLGGDPLARLFDRQCRSYWVECPPKTRTLEDFREQF